MKKHSLNSADSRRGPALRGYLARLLCIGFAAAVFACSLIADGLQNGNGGYHFNHKVAVLEYHHIDPEASAYTITPDVFRQHLQTLKKHHYQVISMQQLLDFIHRKGTVPPDAVVLTFDDGYESFYQYAYPILKEEGMVATNFLIVSYLGTVPETGPAFMTWDQIRQMSGEGFQFYSHTYNAHDFVADADGKPVDPLTGPVYSNDLNRMETKEEYKQRVKDDLERAEQIIRDELGVQDQILCLPHGRYNRSLLDIGDEIGIDAFVTGIDGLNQPGTRLIKRINAGSAKVTPEKLLRKLNDETTVFGKLKITLKNLIVKRRMSE